MTAMPAPISVLLVVLTAVIILGRLWLVNDQLIDRLLNRALCWVALGMTCFVCLAGVCGQVRATYLFLAFGPLSIVNMYGIARLLDGADQDLVARRQRYFDRFAMGAALLILFGAVTGLHELAEWAWAACNLVTIAAGPVVVRACVRELRADGTWRERAAYAALLVVSLYLAVGSATVVVRVAQGLPTATKGPVSVLISYLVLILLCLLIAIPMVRALLRRLGLDRDSRRWRRLLPLWQDLTAAVPEVVLARDATYSDTPALRLYRTTVEIRDALLQLRLYAAAELPDPGSDIKGYARRIAAAARAKAQGQPAHESAESGPIAAPADRTAELRTLFALTAAWPAAQAAVIATGQPQRC
ncbi:MAB_1171c family putative transporter [Nocardia sp. NPDC051832]|uniref:MAB_1171c family putative transporter n=1 Tax=Nocardia sp. NPDC051832 TaxID=3155673 RepID=UPI00342CB08A